MNALGQLQVDIGARIESDAYFSDISVFVLRPRITKEGVETKLTDLQSQIENATNGLTLKDGKAGAAVTVLMPLLDVPDDKSAGPDTRIVTTVRVQELTVINMGPMGTKKPVEEIAIEVLRLLHNCNITGGIAAAPERVLRADRRAITPSLEFAPKLTCDVTVAISFGLGARQSVAQPSISISGSTATLSCATPGASIYYTLDGSYPGASAQLYAAPITLPSPPSTLRAAAYLAGKTGSDVITKNLT